MAWSVPKIGTIATVASGDLTLTEPAGIAQGDLMIACIAIRGTVGFANGDWTLIESQLTGDTDATNGIASGEMWYCIRGASAPSLVFTRTGGNVGHGKIIAYSGQKTSPLDVHSSNTLASASNTATTGTITTSVLNDLIVAMTACGDNLTTSAFNATNPGTASGATDTTTEPTGGTWLERSDEGTGSGADTALAIADAIRVSAGATGTIQSTVSTSARHVMIAAAFLLGPVVASGTDGAKAGDSATAILHPATRSATDGAKAGDTGSGGLRYPKSGTDGGRAGEARSVTIEFELPSEGAKASDASTSRYIGRPSITDGGKASDTGSASIRVGRSGTDGCKAGDNATFTYIPAGGTTYQKSGTDGAKAGDTGSSRLDAVASGTDGGKASDVGTNVWQGVRSGTDGAKAGDNSTYTYIPAGGTTYQKSGTDGAKAGEARQVVIEFALPSEGAKAGDSATSALAAPGTTYQRSGTDGAKAGEQRRLTVEFSLPQEGAKASDSASAAVTGGGPFISKSGSDGAKAGESYVFATRLNFPDETGKAGDAAGIGLIFPIPYDGAKAGDSASSTVQTTVKSSFGTDGAKATDSATKVSKRLGSGTDGAKASDTAIALVQPGVIPKSSSDGAKASDSASSLNFAGRTATDGAKAKDTGLQRVTFIIPFEGTKATDSASVAFRKAGTDGAKATDSATEVRISGLGPASATDGAKASDVAIGGFKFAAVASDGVKAGDTSNIGAGEFLADGVLAGDEASYNFISGCPEPSTPPYDCGGAVDDASYQCANPAYVLHEDDV